MKQHDAPEGFGREELRPGHGPAPGVPAGGEAADSPAAHRIKIGRLIIDVATAEQYPVDGQDRAANVEAAYALAIPLSGSLNFRQGCSDEIAMPGEYVLLNQAAFDALFSQSRLDLIVVHIPAAELRGRLACVDDHLGRRFSANAPMTSLLVDLIRGVTEMFADRPPPNPEALATQILGFVALTIGVEDRGAVLDVRNARYYLRRRIFDYIENHLGDHDLSPKKIAASSRISLSYLYSLFSDDDATVAQFVHTKRLQRAYELLAADQKGHRTVSEVAYDVGFKNVSHFSRSFSRRFGVSPRGMHQPGRPNTREAQGGRLKPSSGLDAFVVDDAAPTAPHDTI